MQMKIYRTFSALLSLLVAVILTTGCASFPQQKPEESLKKRVDILMQAKIDGRWDTVYDLYDSSFRKTTHKEKFVYGTKNMHFKNYSIEEIKILPSGKEADVKIKSEISVQGFDFKGVPETQHWIKEKGKWFMKVRSQKHPFVPKKK